MSPNKGKQTHAKSPTRSHSKTNYTQNELAKQQAKEIGELKKEIAQLKQNQNDKLRNKDTMTKTIKMTIQKTCKRPPTAGAKNNPTSKQK